MSFKKPNVTASDNIERHPNYILSYVFIALGFFANSFLATNPDHIYPIFRDVIVVLFFMFAVLCAIHNSPYPGKRNFLGSSELWLIRVAFLLLGILTIRAVFALQSSNPDLHTCFSAGAILHRFECFLYPGAGSQTSIRILLPHFFALFVAVLAMIFSRQIANVRSLLIFSISAILFIFVSEEIMGRFDFSRSLYVSFFGAREWDRYDQVSGSFTNVGWVWPYLAPINSIAIWLAAGKHQLRIKIFGIFIVSLCVWLAFANGQRGSILCISACLFVCAIWLMMSFAKMTARVKTFKSKFLFFFTLASFVAGVVTFALVFSSRDLDYINNFASFFGFQLSKIPLSVSASRLELWNFAYGLWLEKPFLGNGHASWMNLSVEAAKNSKIFMMYESSHNIFAQTLVELGLLHFLAIFGFFALIATKIFKNLKSVSSGGLLFSLLLTSVFFSIFFQEIDYIRATYYQWAFFIGVLLPDFGEFEAGQMTKKCFLKWIAPVFCLGAISAFTFSNGLFAFEPLSKQNAWPMLERWTGERFTLNFTNKHKNGGLFTVFPIRVDGGENKSALSFFHENSRPILLGLNNNDTVFATFSRNARGIFSKDLFLYPSRRIDSRRVSGRVGYPALESGAEIMFARNVIVESVNGKLGIQCTKYCALAFRQCEDPKKKVVFASDSEPIVIQRTTKAIPLDLGQLSSWIELWEAQNASSVAESSAGTNLLEIIFISKIDDNMMFHDFRCE
jgi:O-antigen ligase